MISLHRGQAWDLDEDPNLIREVREQEGLTLAQYVH